MVTNIIVPKLGLDTEPLALSEWLVPEGGRIEKGNPVLMVETAKTVSEIEAQASGFLHILIEEGKYAPIGTVAGLIAETKEELEALQREAPKVRAVADCPGEAHKAEASEPAAAAPVKGRIDISPVARKMAEEHMIDIGSIAGTGPGGRIVKEDILREIEGKGTSSEPLKNDFETSATTETPFSATGRIIADRLTRSWQTAPHFYLFKDVDMTDALAWRKEYNQKKEAKISVNEMIVKAAATALAEFPRLNAHVAQDKMILYKNINIGLAVESERGLIVPVIPDVGNHSIEEIIRLTAETIESAKNGVSKYPCVGTFTISNLSMYLVDSFLPIINPPECAILGVGGINKRAVPIKDSIVIRDIMSLTLACDHRGVDGVYGSGFLKVLKRRLEKFPS
jgi:pyruvate dehydrogenase E2 component (dihydrolipoamide acetyltransferase)